MPYYDEFRFSFGHLSPEQKLANLRPEALRILMRLQGYGALLLQVIKQPSSEERPEDLEEWCKQIVDGSSELRDLIEAFTWPHHKDGQLGLPELRPYDSLLDAVRETAHKLALPIASTIDDTSKVFLHSQYPLVLLDEPRYQREVMFSLVESDYSVQLLSWTDQRMFRVEYEVSPSSLDEAVTIISHWLMEHWTTDEIKQVSRHPSGG